MARVFLSHSSRDNRQAVAVRAWLIEHEPGLAEEIFLDLDPHTGIRPGERWRQALQQANTRCEAVICLLSKHWEASHECQTEFRYAENLGKTILCARLEPVPDTNITSEWQRCDLFPDHGPTTQVEIAHGGEPMVLNSVGLQRLLEALGALGIGAEHFPWPPPGEPDRRPVSGVGTAGGRRRGGVLRARRPDPARVGCAARDAHLWVAVDVPCARPVWGGQVVVSAGGSIRRLQGKDFQWRCCCNCPLAKGLTELASSWRPTATILLGG